MRTQKLEGMEKGLKKKKKRQERQAEKRQGGSDKDEVNHMGHKEKEAREREKEV